MLPMHKFVSYEQLVKKLITNLPIPYIWTYVTAKTYIIFHLATVVFKTQFIKHIPNYFTNNFTVMFVLHSMYKINTCFINAI